MLELDTVCLLSEGTVEAPLVFPTHTSRTETREGSDPSPSRRKRQVLGPLPGLEVHPSLGKDGPNPNLGLTDLNVGSLRL